MENLTVQEIDTLNDALDSFVEKESRDHAMADIMKSLFLGVMDDKKDPGAAKFLEEENKRMKDMRIEIEAKKRLLKDRITLIKAKLVQMKTQIQVESLISSTTKNG